MDWEAQMTKRDQEAIKQYISFVIVLIFDEEHRDIIRIIMKIPSIILRSLQSLWTVFVAGVCP